MASIAWVNFGRNSSTPASLKMALVGIEKAPSRPKSNGAIFRPEERVRAQKVDTREVASHALEYRNRGLSDRFVDAGRNLRNSPWVLNSQVTNPRRFRSLPSRRTGTWLNRMMVRVCGVNST